MMRKLLAHHKLHPSSQKFSLRSEHLKNIIKKAAKLNIPIIFDSGKKESPPEQFGELADLFPDAKIIMAHMLGDFLRVALHHQNIYLQDKTQLFVPAFGGISDLATLYTKM